MIVLYCLITIAYALHLLGHYKERDEADIITKPQEHAASTTVYPKCPVTW